MPEPRITGPLDPIDQLEAGKALPLDQFVTFKVNQLSLAFERQWTRFMREQVGLSLAEWRIVATLSGHEQLTFSQVIAATDMNKSLCSRCTKSLQRQSLVEAVETPGDSRSVTLSLTAPGRRLVAKLRPVVLERQRMLLGALTRQERLSLYGAIDKLHAAAANWEDTQGRP